MKILCYIFCLYLLALSFLPCGDMVSSHDHAQQTITVSGNHQHCHDACSPFCSCSCCTAPAFVIADEEFQTVGSPVHINQPSKQPLLLLSQHLSAIWQPPKIG